MKFIIRKLTSYAQEQFYILLYLTLMLHSFGNHYIFLPHKRHLSKYNNLSILREAYTSLKLICVLKFQLIYVEPLIIYKKKDKRTEKLLHFIRCGFYRAVEC